MRSGASPSSLRTATIDMQWVFVVGCCLFGNVFPVSQRPPSWGVALGDQTLRSKSVCGGLLMFSSKVPWVHAFSEKSHLRVLLKLWRPFHACFVSVIWSDLDQTITSRGWTGPGRSVSHSYIRDLSCTMEKATFLLALTSFTHSPLRLFSGLVRLEVDSPWKGRSSCADELRGNMNRQTKKVKMWQNFLRTHRSCPHEVSVFLSNFEIWSKNRPLSVFAALPTFQKRLEHFEKLKVQRTSKPQLSERRYRIWKSARGSILKCCSVCSLESAGFDTQHVVPCLHVRCSAVCTNRALFQLSRWSLLKGETSVRSLRLQVSKGFGAHVRSLIVSIQRLVYRTDDSLSWEILQLHGPWHHSQKLAPWSSRWFEKPECIATKMQTTKIHASERYTTETPVIRMQFYIFVVVENVPKCTESFCTSKIVT